MPELPDVECFRRRFEAVARHRTVASVSVPDPRLLEAVTPQALGRHLDGRHLERTDRLGKYLFADFGDGWLVLHFGMSGYLERVEADAAPLKHAALELRFEQGGRLVFADPRRLGRIALAESPQRFARERGLGADAAAVSRQTFEALARGRRGAVKGWLTDQATLSGIGNIYADEVLFQARLHPQSDIGRLDAATLARLHRRLHEVIEAAIAAGADPQRMPAGFLLPHRHEGGHCPACGGKLIRLRLGGRSAWYCPRCQPAPADVFEPSPGSN